MKNKYSFLRIYNYQAGIALIAWVVVVRLKARNCSLLEWLNYFSSREEYCMSKQYCKHIQALYVSIRLCIHLPKFLFCSRTC